MLYFEELRPQRSLAISASLSSPVAMAKAFLKQKKIKLNQRRGISGVIYDRTLNKLPALLIETISIEVLNPLAGKRELSENFSVRIFLESVRLSLFSQFLSDKRDLHRLEPIQSAKKVYTGS